MRPGRPAICMFYLIGILYTELGLARGTHEEVAPGQVLGNTKKTSVSMESDFVDRANPAKSLSRSSKPEWRPK